MVDPIHLAKGVLIITAEPALYAWGLLPVKPCTEGADLRITQPAWPNRLSMCCFQDTTHRSCQDFLVPPYMTLPGRAGYLGHDDLAHKWIQQLLYIFLLYSFYYVQYTATRLYLWPWGGQQGFHYFHCLLVNPGSFLPKMDSMI